MQDDQGKKLEALWERLGQVITAPAPGTEMVLKQLRETTGALTQAARSKDEFLAALAGLTQ